MLLIEEVVINNCPVKYYSGFDIESIINHPKDGSSGMMIVFFNSVKIEERKYKRNQLISYILDFKKSLSFWEIVDSLDNPYLSLYETHGYTDLIYKSIKNKLEVISDYNFQHTKTLWGLA